MTTLSSKIINVHKKEMAKIAVDAVMAVANLERNDVNFDMIKVRSVCCVRELRLSILAALIQLVVVVLVLLLLLLLLFLCFLINS